MAANPMYVQAPQVEFARVTTVNTAMDGTGTVGTNIWLVFTGDATLSPAIGSYWDFLMARPVATNVASVLRIWGNNGSTNATATNNWLIHELTLPVTTASAVSSMTPLFWTPPWHLLPTTYRIYVTVGTAVTGWDISCHGGRY